jgi:hypothetical protein
MYSRPVFRDLHQLGSYKKKVQVFVLNFISMLLHCTVSKIRLKTQLLYKHVLNKTSNIFPTYSTLHVGILRGRAFVLYYMIA